MLELKFTYRGRLLFSVGNIGYAIFYFICFVWSIGWLAIGIYCLLTDSIGLGIWGLIIGLICTLLSIFGVYDGINEYRRDKLMKNISSCRDGNCLKHVHELFQNGEKHSVLVKDDVWEGMCMLYKFEHHKWENNELELAKYIYTYLYGKY